MSPAERADVAATLAAAIPLPDGSRITYRCALFPVRPAQPGRVLSSRWIEPPDGPGRWAYRVRLDVGAALSPVFAEEITSC